MILWDCIFEKILLKNDYGYMNNKKINKKIKCKNFPCDNDIFFAYVILYLNNWLKKDSNIIAAFIFKWINEQVIYVKEENDKIYFIHNNLNLIKDEIEKELYENIFSKSTNGILELSVFEQYINEDQLYIASLIKKMHINVMRFLTKRKFIYKTENNSCKKVNTMSDDLFEISQQLYGLKNYIDNISKDEVINDKSKYICYACIFGNVEKIDNNLAKKIKKLNIKLEE